MRRPTLRIFAGPNGSGKSTLTSLSRYRLQQNSMLDPDAVALSLQDSLPRVASLIDAGRQVLHLADELIARKQSFTVETTLSGNTYIKMALRAKQADFNVLVVFVGTNSLDINIERIKARVILGGHDVPEEDQRRRYPRSFANIRKLVPISDLAVIVDNSGSAPELLGYGRRGRIQWNENLPEWAESLRHDLHQS